VIITPGTRACRERSSSQACAPPRALGLELAADFVVMYLVMYNMIATLDHLYLNINNNVYMTLMMVAPMAVIMPSD
jgi:hypothetical protein